MQQKKQKRVGVIKVTGRFDLPFDKLPQELLKIINYLKMYWTGDPSEGLKDISKEIDWSLFMWWIKRHRIAPLIHQVMEKINNEDIPESIRRKIRAAVEDNLRRNMLLAGEAIRLIKLFQDKNIPTMQFKGVVVALKVYGSLSLRHAGDIDILVPIDSVERAEQVLSESGYMGAIPNFEGSLQRRNHFKQVVRDKEYLHQNGRIRVELHWRLSHYKFIYPVDFENLMAQAQSMFVTDHVISVFSDEDMLLHLYEHGASHGWFRLFWLCDVAEILYKNTNINWTKLIEKADRLNTLRPLVQGTMLAHILFNSPLPTHVQQLAEKDRTIVYLIREAFRHLMTPVPIHQLPPMTEIPGKRRMALRRLAKRIRITVCYETRLHHDIRHKFDVIREFASFRPADWFILRLPAPLTPFYYILRPFLWIWRQLCSKN